MDKLADLLVDIEILFGEESIEYNDAYHDLNDICESIKDLEKNLNDMLNGA